MAKEKSEKGGGGGGLTGFLIALVLLTIVGGGAGFLAGSQLKRNLTAPHGPEAAVSEPKVDKNATAQLLEMPAVVTNLAGEKAPWVRLEASVLLADTKPIIPGFAAQLADDATALLRTLNLSQIAGPAGFQHFREELLQRFNTRTTGRVKELTIQSMIIE